MPQQPVNRIMKHKNFHHRGHRGHREGRVPYFFLLCALCVLCGELLVQAQEPQPQTLQEQEPPSSPATLQEQIADESIPIASRTWALTLHATCLYATGEARTAAQLLDDWHKAHADQPFPAAYYSARFFIAWLGQGDAETARRQIKQMDALIAKGEIPADDPHYTLMTQSYYNHLFASKIERSSQYAKRLAGW